MADSTRQNDPKYMHAEKTIIMWLIYMRKGTPDLYQLPINCGLRIRDQYTTGGDSCDYTSVWALNWCTYRRIQSAYTPGKNTGIRNWFKLAI